MNIRKKEKGFTIIEVVLVLAIAGLIFMMVFLALPALQRSQRDTQRKQDLSRIQVALTSYTTSNRGALPALPKAWTDFEKSYLIVNGDTFVDPLGSTTAQGGNITSYVLTQSFTTPLTTTFNGANGVDGGQNTIFYSPGYVCGSSNDSIVQQGSRSVAFRMVLEGGGFDCRSN